MPRGGKRKGAGRKASLKKLDVLAQLTLRKRLYLDGLAQGKTKQQSALDAGYAESTAKTAKAHIETADVQGAFAELIQAVIPSEKIVARIAEGLDATETKLYAFQGMIFDREDLIAWTERREYAKLAAEFGRYFVQTQKTEGEVEHNHSGEVKVTVEFIGGA
jgi:hypothetical protein